MSLTFTKYALTSCVGESVLIPGWPRFRCKRSALPLS
jgi:hypothetical protein